MSFLGKTRLTIMDGGVEGEMNGWKLGGMLGRDLHAGNFGRVLRAIRRRRFGPCPI